MTIAITEEHRQLADSIAAWAASHAPPSAARAVLDAGDGEGDDPVPAIWTGIADQGLLAMHVPEDLGGAGYGVLELAVAAEQLGRALVPGPFLPTAAISTVLAIAGPEVVGKRFLPGLADGSTRGGLALAPALTATRRGSSLTLDGTTGPVLGAPDADVLLLGARDDDGREVWACVAAANVAITAAAGLDGTRSIGSVRCDGVMVDDDGLVADLDTDTLRALAVIPAAAEAAGIAGWCLDTAVAHAKVREQFGRPIGQFQAVKHACAEMLVEVEQARAAAWDAARAATDPAQRLLASAVAGAVALDAAVTCAKECIQLLGGIGFTWEHDAHLYLKRATAIRQLFGEATRWRADVAAAALAGDRRHLELDLGGDEAARVRAEVDAFLADLPDDDTARRRAIADAGYLVPHWPAPWGRDASPVAQLVIDEAFDDAGIERPSLVIGGWILPTIIRFGTPEQQERFVPATLRGEITWCQMFSEPGAGSDLASLSTRAVRVDGGWSLTGQKVWTSLARESDWALCLARTNPEAPKHEGITAFLIDMSSAGLDVRPLKEITGRAMFNEIFLTDVFVPDDCVVGPVDGGWKAARTTLANERVAMSSGSSMGAGVEGVLATVAATGAGDDPVLADRVAQLVCEGQVLGLLGFRTTLAQLSGVEPGASSSVRKLVGGRHTQACTETVLSLLGPAGATTDDGAGKATYQFLQSQCLTIAGGTTAVQRNVVAERLLGLPRD